LLSGWKIKGWHGRETGHNKLFLPRTISILEFGATYPPDVLREMLVEAGGSNVQVRRLSLGGGLVAWGVRAVR